MSLLRLQQCRNIKKVLVTITVQKRIGIILIIITGARSNSHYINTPYYINNPTITHGRPVRHDYKK